MSFPPACQKFEANGYGIWSREQWDAAREASRLFDDPFRSKLLGLCSEVGLPSASCFFMLAYENALLHAANLTVVPPLLNWWSDPVVQEVAAEPTSSAEAELESPSTFDVTDDKWTPGLWEKARKAAVNFPDEEAWVFSMWLIGIQGEVCSSGSTTFDLTSCPQDTFSLTSMYIITFIRR